MQWVEVCYLSSKRWSTGKKRQEDFFHHILKWEASLQGWVLCFLIWIQRSTLDSCWPLPRHPGKIKHNYSVSEALFSACTLRSYFHPYSDEYEEAEERYNDDYKVVKAELLLKVSLRTLSRKLACETLRWRRPMSSVRVHLGYKDYRREKKQDYAA